MRRTWRCGNSGPGNECAAQAAAPVGRERKERRLEPVREEDAEQSSVFLALPGKCLHVTVATFYSPEDMHLQNSCICSSVQNTQ